MLQSERDATHLRPLAEILGPRYSYHQQNV